MPMDLSDLLAQVRLDNLSLSGKTVLIREDLNVPFDQNGLISTARIDRALETVRALQSENARIILMSHLGRPKGRDENYTLQPIADYLSLQLDQKVILFNLGDPVPVMKDRSVVLLENVRFYPGETDNKDSLSEQYASLADIFVMDAFGASHRAHASTTGVIEFAKAVAMGPLLAQELSVLYQVLDNPKRPTVAIVGGSKVSTKLNVLLNLIERVDTLVVGGALANTFLLASGVNVGSSMTEPDLVPMAQQILHRAKSLGKTCWMPMDVVVARSIDALPEQTNIRLISDIQAGESVFDIGPKSIASLRTILQQAQTILWNGPLGVFEKPAFRAGTQALAELIANAPAFSLAGGGETIAAIEMFGIDNHIDYISTGGGAFLEVLEGKTLPVIEAFRARIEQQVIKTS